MKKWYETVRTRCKTWVAATLLTVLFIGEILPTAPVMVVSAAPLESPSLTSVYEDGVTDPWEEIEAHGEVLITFPSLIRSTISSAQDVDVFNFTLDDTTDLILTLDSSSPCRLFLSRNGVLVAQSDLPYDQSIELSELAAGVYTVTVSPQADTAYADYELSTRSQMEDTVIPDYSELHIAGTAYDRTSPYRWEDLEGDDMDKGGAPVIAVNYLAHWQGPIDDSYVPYYDGEDDMETPSDYIKYVDADSTKREYHIPNAYFLPTNEAEGYQTHWKNAIMTYGAIDTGFQFFLPSLNGLNEGASTGYWYVPKDETDLAVGGHATTIVGWDDSIEHEKFRVASGSDAWMPEEDGAWICKDSYGQNNPMSGEGMEGYFYISYEDAILGSRGMTAVVFPKGESVDNYNHLYSNSANGMLDLALEWQDISLSQIFQTGDEPEVLRAAGFTVNNHDFSYRIYVRVGEEEPFMAKSGFEKYGGFHTERLDGGIVIPADTEFEVIVSIALPEDTEDTLNFFFARDVPGWIDGIKKQAGKSYLLEYDEEQRQWEAVQDLSADGIYPSILAYTYAPTMREKITLLDIREEFNSKKEDNDPEIPIATDSDAYFERPVKATDSDARSKRPLKASASDAFAEIPSQDYKNKWRFSSGHRMLPNPVSVGSEPLHVTLPSHYDLREEGQITVPKNQGVSNLCWTFAAVAAMESSYLKGGSNMINYPRGLNLYSGDGTIQDGTIELELAPGEECPVSFTATLFSDSEYFNPGSDQIYWEISGDMDSVSTGETVSKSAEDARVLTAKSAGTVKVTAVSLADHNLKAACTVEITEKVPAKVTLNVSSVNLYQGDTYKLQASTESDEALTVRFSSDNPSVAEVSADGTILAMRSGTAVITARAGEGFATCEVTVLQSDEDDGNGDYTDTSFRKTTGRPRADIAADTVIGLWIQDGTGWWLMKEDGSYPVSSWERVNGNWYYFKEDGYLATGWVNQEGIWYYLSKDSALWGRMSTGWIYDPEYQSWFYLNPDGTMAVGWQTIDGKRYYFNPVSDGTKGRLCADTNAPVTDKVGDAVL